MSEALIVRRGGTGGMPLSNAIIHAKAPYGSTVTFSKGGVVVKTIGPDKAHANNDGVYADYYLSVSANNYGKWTITATDGTNTASTTVLITTNKAYEVMLGYKLWLYKNGNTYDSTTGGWQVKNYNSDSTIALREDRIYIKVSWSSGCVATVSKVDVTDYSSMHVVFNSLNYSSGSNFYAGLKESSPDSTDAHEGSRLNPYAAVKGSGTDIDIVVDTSRVFGLYYVEVACSAIVETAITQIWLEP